jgi:hypothetical protein
MIPLPFGTLELDPRPFIVAGRPKRIRCFVRGCEELMRPPAENPVFAGEACPDHGIRCHSSGTYSYPDVRRNIIASPDLFATRVVGHPFKYESDRLGNERSEDALSWNVFRTLQECGLLHLVARWITGRESQEEPRLYLWGLSVSDNTFDPWNLLIDARKRFETKLPVERPLTEPDIALYLPGQYLILIEAKFTSPNSFYVDGPRKDDRSLTKNELLDRYRDPALRSLDVEKARGSERVYYQLWRNMVFAEWMANADNLGTKAYLTSLTRAGTEHASCQHFAGMVNPGFADRFVELSWEDIDARLPRTAEFDRLHRYLETKTAGLKRAFRLGTVAAQ